MQKMSLVTEGNVSQFGTNRSKEVFWHRRVWNGLGFGRAHIGFYFTITSSPPRQNFISLAVTQEATVNWNLSSMLLQYLGSYYPLGLRSLSPVLKMVLIWEDVFCGGKIQFCYENCSLILSVCLFIEYYISVLTFGGKCCTANHWARFDIMFLYYLSVLGFVFVIVMDSCIL